MHFQCELFHNVLFFSAFPDPGFNQQPVLDDDLSDVVDFDRLSYLADDGASDSEAPTCAFIDWEAEEDEVCEPNFKKTRAYNENDENQ